MTAVQLTTMRRALEAVALRGLIAARFDAEHDFDFRDHVVMLARVPKEHGITAIAAYIPPLPYLVGLEHVPSMWVEPIGDEVVVVYPFQELARLIATGDTFLSKVLAAATYLIRRAPFKRLVEDRSQDVKAMSRLVAHLTLDWIDLDRAQHRLRAQGVPDRELNPEREL